MNATPPSDAPARAAPTRAQTVRSRRLTQIATFATLAIMARMVSFLALGGAWDAVQVALACGLVLMLFVLWLNRLQGPDIAGPVFAVSLTAMGSGLVWNGEGVHDTALLVFPSLLIFAGLLMRPRYFYALLVYMMVFIGYIGWRSMTGPPAPAIDPLYNDYFRAFELILILAISSMCIQMLTRDLSAALQSAQNANQALEESQTSLAYLAQHDALTGLPNRRMGRDRIAQALQSARRHDSRAAVLFVDVDKFKSINDTYGHDFGDSFLKTVADRLKLAVRETDIVSRQGGDEFVICITDVRDLPVVATVADKVLALLRQPVSSQNQGVFPSCSIGIAIFPDDGEDLDTLVQLADASMYQAKKSGRNVYRFNNPKLMVEPHPTVA